MVVAGHDHDNDFLGLYNGIALAYGRKTGKVSGPGIWFGFKVTNPI